jgi:diguanylate cyclase (GGDEF)-like protein/PAS domain S-box-containing protein
VVIIALDTAALAVLTVLGSPNDLTELLPLGGVLIAVALTCSVGAALQRHHAGRLERITHDTETILSSAGEGIFRLDVRGRITYVNRAGAHMLAAKPEDLLGRSMHALAHHSHADGRPYPAEDCPMGATLREGTAQRVTGEVMWRVDGTSFPIEYHSAPITEGGRITGGVIVVSDTTEERMMHDALLHQSMHDPLTRLPNRALLSDRLERAVERMLRTPDRVLGVLFLDLDNFKDINDSRGHGVGDELLQVLSPRLASVLRTSDTLARFGGDEFVVLCEQLTGPEEAVEVAERLMDCLRDPIVAGGAEHFLAASIGVATAAGHYRGGAEGLLRDADAAMYRAKAGGRGRIEVFDEVMRARIVERIQIETELRHALQRGELRLVYQPILGLGSEVYRAEALLRWEHPEQGMVSPVDFIPVAEESGLIVQIGAWVLDEACRQGATWMRSDDPHIAGLRVAVNVSARQLADADLVSVVEATLRRHEMPAGSVVLEVTETALIDDPERAARALESLRALGVIISLDDFGTGYSSLSSLKDFPLSAIKIDRSFIAGMVPGSREAAIVEGLLAMGRSLDLSTVAEGVETSEQLERLTALGCQYGQGYLLSRPVAPDELERLICSGELRRRLRAASGVAA